MMETIGKYLTSTWAAAISVCLLIVLYVYNPSPIQTLQLKTFDYLITSLPEKKSEEMVIVNFGEKSVEKFGQWPFDRKDIAETIQQSKNQKVKRKKNYGVLYTLPLTIWLTLFFVIPTSIIFSRESLEKELTRKIIRLSRICF